MCLSILIGLVLFVIGKRRIDPNALPMFVFNMVGMSALLFRILHQISGAKVCIVSELRTRGLALNLRAPFLVATSFIFKLCYWTGADVF